MKDTIQKHDTHERRTGALRRFRLNSTKQEALEHALADKALGRSWQCACGTCRVAKSCSACARFVLEIMQEAQP